MPARKNQQGVVPIVSLLVVGFLTLSLVALTKVTSDPNTKQAIQSWAKERIKTAEDRGSPKARQAQRIAEGSSTTGKKEDIPAVQTAAQPQQPSNSGHGPDDGATSGAPTTTNTQTDSNPFANHTNLELQADQNTKTTSKTQNPFEKFAGSLNLELQADKNIPTQKITQTVTVDKDSGNSNLIQQPAQAPTVVTNSQDNTPINNSLSNAPSNQTQQAQNVLTEWDRIVKNPFGELVNNASTLLSGITGTKPPGTTPVQPQDLTLPADQNPINPNGKPLIVGSGINPGKQADTTPTRLPSDLSKIPKGFSDYNDSSGNKVSVISGNKEEITAGSTTYDTKTNVLNAGILFATKQGDTGYYSVSGPIDYTLVSTYDKSGTKLLNQQIVRIAPQSALIRTNAMGLENPPIAIQKRDYTTNKMILISYETNSKGEIISGNAIVYNGDFPSNAYKDDIETWIENQKIKATIFLDNIIGVDYKIPVQ